MTLVEFAYSNLKRRPARTLLTILGIALAIGTAVALLALGRGIYESLAEGFTERSSELLVTQRNVIDITAMRLPESMGLELAAVDGVAEVSSELYVFTSTPAGQQVMVAGVSDSAAKWALVPVASGRRPDAGRPEIMLGDVIAQTLGAKVGDRIELLDEEFEVVGITAYGTALNRGVAAMPLKVLQEASLRLAQVSTFSIRLDPGLSQVRKREVRAAIEQRLPVVVSDMQEIADRLSSDRNITILKAVSNAISIVAVVMGALNLLATLLLSVQERTREIGMLSSIGWSDRLVISLIMIEGLFIGILGCVGGVLVGLAASSLFGSIPAIGDIISFTPSLSDLVLPVAFAIPLCMVGAAYPAWRAVHMLPAEALRHA
ncbi:MAG: ABC transporter permease [Mesorhizobium sp.]|nr:ABC transporter permease [Mesorhizobium sp.]